MKAAKALCVTLLMLFSCGLGAVADDMPLQEQQGKSDVPQPPPARPMLNGKVSAETSAETLEQGRNLSGMSDETRKRVFKSAAQFLTPDQQDALRDALNGNARQNIFLLRAQDAGQLNELMSEQPKLSNEQFRKMEYGVVGFISTVTIGQANPIVTEVFPGCPAAQAGIRVGDILVSAGQHVFRVGDGQRTVWKTVGGKAGTAVEIKLLREGEIMAFTLVRMNFEDIPDPARRHMYELYLSRFGPPADDQ